MLPPLAWLSLVPEFLSGRAESVPQPATLWLLAVQETDETDGGKQLSDVSQSEHTGGLAGLRWVGGGSYPDPGFSLLLLQGPRER